MVKSVRNSAGFTLLEAIVALVIFAAVASALYSWVAVNVRAVGQVEMARQRDEAIDAALAMLQHINPVEQREGVIEAGHFEISWSSELIAGPLAGLSPAAGVSLYEVSLFQLHVAVFDGSRSHFFSTRKAGWRQVWEGSPI